MRPYRRAHARFVLVRVLCFTRVRVCDMRVYMGARLLSPHTFRRGDERNRGVRGVVSTSFPFHSTFCPLSLSRRSLFLSLPFLVLTFSLSIVLPLSSSLYIRFPVCSSTVCCFTHTLTYSLYPPAHVSVSDTRTRYAFLVGCIFQNCGHSYSALCNMHAVEGTDCNARSLRVQLAREREREGQTERKRDIGGERKRGHGMMVALEGERVGLERGAVDSCGELTGVRVTGSHIGELRVPYARGKKRER